MKKMNGLLILITGASSGIGEASAKLLAKKGAEVILLARGEENLKRVCDEIANDNGTASYYSVDLSNGEAIAKTTQQIKKEKGIPDIIINNAGAGNWLSILETSSDEFEKMQAVPHHAAFHITKAFIHEMKERNKGHIININSASCYFSYPGAMGYLSSRWALRSFSEALHSELYATGIDVSMIVAGKVDSPYFTNNPISAERIPKIAPMLTGTLTLDKVANTIAKTIHSRRKTVIIPFSMNVLVNMNRFFPRIFSYLLRKTGYKMD